MILLENLTHHGKGGAITPISVAPSILVLQKRTTKRRRRRRRGRRKVKEIFTLLLRRTMKRTVMEPCLHRPAKAGTFKVSLLLLLACLFVCM